MLSVYGFERRPQRPISKYNVGQLSSRTAKILLKTNISFNIYQNNLLEMSHTFMLAQKIVGNTF
jgi:hypothetical protein